GYIEPIVQYRQEPKVQKQNKGTFSSILLIYWIIYFQKIVKIGRGSHRRGGIAGTKKPSQEGKILGGYFI
ncbi:hypothetical protein WKC52_19200, partial [Morganella morganii]|uniref:hypothetical protein n=1 Tax=Morganella morganii TaxID=582 RepID=UPI00311984C1